MLNNITKGSLGGSCLYTFGNKQNNGSAYNEIVKDMTFLTKLACYKYYKNEPTSEVFENVNKQHLDVYSELNKGAKKKVLNYVLDQCGCNADVSTMTDQQKSFYLEDGRANKLLFSIIVDVLSGINADNEIEDALMFTNIQACNRGNSANFQIDSKALYPIQKSSWNTNVTRPNTSYVDSINVIPEAYKCGVALSLTQLDLDAYDMGKEVAKVVMSFRVGLFGQVIDTIFNQPSAVLTPFYMNTFSAQEYVQKVGLLEGANGGAKASAYATLSAFNKISSTVDGFTIKDEYAKTAMIRDLYGVPTNVITQKPNTTSIQAGATSLDFDGRVPEDKILVMSAIGDKPVKTAHAMETRILQNDGMNGNGVDTQSFVIEQGWGMKLATQGNIMLVETN